MVRRPDEDRTVRGEGDARGRDDWPEGRPAAWRLLARLDRSLRFSRLFGTDRDAILLYHSIGGIPGADYDWNLTRAEFREQIELVSDLFEPVDLSEMVNGRDVNGSDTDSKRVAVTFDDGFRSFYEVAVPVLREFDVPATVFVCPAFFADANLDVFRERHDLGPNAHDFGLTSSQVREIATTDLFSVGNHTATHARLSDLDTREATAEEVLGAKERLEAVTHKPVDRFSYPYGGYDARAADIVAESHTLAVTSEPGLVTQSTSPYQLPRIDACLPLDLLRFETTDLGDRLRRSARRLGEPLP
jgi:peptidoglycan/xylan/chitin deacetylase (PgdA/CDA1 family)